ncbi:MAG: response regulator [Acidimicrobiales bacterium]
MTPVKVVIADDHEVSRIGIKGILGPGFEVAVEATKATEAIAAIGEHQPDVVVCDMQLPEGGGMAVVEACATETNIIVASMSMHERDLLDVVAGGAVGYLLKEASANHLRSAVRSAARGEFVLCSTMTAIVLKEFRQLAAVQRCKGVLSDCERGVVHLVASGMTYNAIGEQLFISPKTVRNHIANSLKKLKLSNKSELIQYVNAGRPL